MNEKSRNYPPANISVDPEMRGGRTDELIDESVRSVGTLLARREDLLSRTGIDGEDVERDLSELNASLDFASSELCLLRAATPRGLISKFECLDLLLETFEPEYRQVPRFQDALLQECRDMVEASASPTGTLSEMMTNGRTGSFPSLIRVFPGLGRVKGRWRSRRSQE